MNMKDGWFEILEFGDETLLQGDVFFSCPFIYPPAIIDFSEGDTLEVDIAKADVIVLSQSCDLENDKITIVLVCPLIPLGDFWHAQDATSKKAKKSVFSKLTQGALPGFHPLAPFPDDGQYFIVDFKNVFGVHIDFLREFCKKQERRVRLNQPYREHLSQGFARFFMRVGLPQGIVPPSLD